MKNENKKRLFNNSCFHIMCFILVTLPKIFPDKRLLTFFTGFKNAFNELLLSFLSFFLTYNLKFSSKQIKKPVQPSETNGSKGFVFIISM